MKTFKKILLGIILSIPFFTFSSCNKTDNTEEENNIILTMEEKEALQFMREEEKLARDVYTYFNAKYDFFIFKNISGSEQKHMDFILELMTKYQLPDNASNEVGVFTNSDLQALYEQLTSQGDASKLEALKVGALIEDLDIKDLQEYTSKMDKEDIIEIFETLECGSRNHLRGFVGQIKNDGGTYNPQYISENYFTEILEGSHESCSP